MTYFIFQILLDSETTRHLDVSVHNRVWNYKGYTISRIVEEWIMYCGVFTPCKNCNLETRSHDYATVDEAVFSPCRAESHLVPPHLLLSDSCKHLEDARVGRGNVHRVALSNPRALPSLPLCH
jgi:hypothetical protein